MRLRNNPQAYVELESSGFLIFNFPIKLNKETIIEIGMGKGEMITSMAKSHPEMSFIGIEKFATVAARAAKKAEELKLKNFSIICNDVAKLENLFEGKVKTIWLTFSDPWPKTRHEKRRLTYKSFLEIYDSILGENGVIKFKTDNDTLFNYSIISMKEYGFKLTNITNDFHNHKASQSNYMTGYELKWSQNGKKINYLEARKK